MIFGEDTANSIPGDPKYDTFVNILYSLLIISTFLISGTLNPSLFLFHSSRPSSTPSILFRILNVSDFLTTTCLCPYLIYGLLSPGLVPHLTPATPGQMVYSAIFGFILFMSVGITSLMTMTRVYVIKYPLKPLTRKQAIRHPMMGLMGLGLTLVLVNSACNTTWNRYLFSTNRLKLVIFRPGTHVIDNWPELAFGGVLMSIAVMGCVCAMITGKDVYRTSRAIELIKRSQSTKKIKKSQSAKEISGTKSQTIKKFIKSHSVAIMVSRRRSSNPAPPVTGQGILLKQTGRNNLLESKEARLRRSYITIIMLSAGVQVAVVLVIVQFVYSICVRVFPYHANYLMYGNGLFCTLVLSVVNPIITVTRTTGFCQFYLKRFRRRMSFSDNSFSSTQ